MPQPPEIPDSESLGSGLYEQVVDAVLESQLQAVSRASFLVDRTELDPGESHVILADHLRQVVRQALAGFTGDDRLPRQIELVNRIVRELEPDLPAADRRVLEPARRLLSIWPGAGTERAVPERPDTPMALGCLLAGTRLDPSLVSQLVKELASADQVDILCSFIKWSGIRILADHLRAWTARSTALTGIPRAAIRPKSTDIRASVLGTPQTRVSRTLVMRSRASFRLRACSSNSR